MNKLPVPQGFWEVISCTIINKRKTSVIFFFSISPLSCGLVFSGPFEIRIRWNRIPSSSSPLWWIKETTSLLEKRSFVSLSLHQQGLRNEGPFRFFRGASIFSSLHCTAHHLTQLVKGADTTDASLLKAFEKERGLRQFFFFRSPFVYNTSSHSTHG